MRLKLPFVALLAVTISLSESSIAQQTVTAGPFMAVLETDPKTLTPGSAGTLDVLVMDAASMAPVKRLRVTASLSMVGMAGMAPAIPAVSVGKKPGHFRIRTTFPQAGAYKLDLTVKPVTGRSVIVSFNLTLGRAGAGKGAGGMQGMPGMKGMSGTPGMEGKQAMPGMPSMGAMQMKASFGNWPANREGSGTSWQPDASPMFMKMLPSLGGFELGAMGTLQAGYVDTGGTRGDKGFFSNSMVMLMGRRELGGGTLGLHFMTSLDPIINGARGVPNLFQNGFTANGMDVADRKDPHNMFSELAASYSHPIVKNWSGFVYGGPVGEPALGNVMYFHRTSGLEVPEAPISHDWFDGTHISFGVVTLGLVYQDNWKLEASAFNGNDPGQSLRTIGAVALNSASGRLSYNPSSDWSYSASYGYLNGDTNAHRLTFSAAYSHKLPGGDNFSATAYFGQNIVTGSDLSNAWLAEATYYHANEGFFARFERVDKGELVNVPPGSYTVNKLLFGDVHNFYTKDQLDFGLGAYAGVYSFPSALNPFYGKSPLTLGVFLRIRPGKM